MKKLITFLLAIATISMGAGCTKQDKPSETIQSEMLSLKSADINMADDFSEILCTDSRERDYFIFGKLNSGEYSGYITNTEFAEKKSFIFSPHEDEVIKTAALMKSRKTAFLTTLDEETFIYTFDSNGNIENTYNLGEILSPDDYFTEMIYAEDGLYININRESLVYIDANGNFKGNVDTGRRIVCGIVNDSNGSPAVLMSQNSNMFLGTLNNGNITEEVECGELTDYTQAICSGKGDYRISAVLPNGLHGLKDNKWEKLSDFSENDFRTSDILDIEMVNNDEYTVLLREINGKTSMRLLSKRDISEIKTKNIIKLANVAISEYDPYNELIKKYNSESEDDKIEVVNYRSELIEDAMRSLDLDIISGNAPDIVLFNSYAPVESFGNRESLFVDMYKLIDNDAEINRNDFLDGFLESLETNGKLLQIAQSFGVNSYMIKEKFANGLNSWSLDELEKIYKANSENMLFTYSSQYLDMNYMLDELLVFSRFYDKDTAECRFNSAEFIETMKFLKNNNIGLAPNATRNTEINSGADYDINAFRKDEVLVQKTEIYGFSYLREYQQVYSDENVIFIGFPSEDNINAISMPIGGYGIMANSQNIEGAWDFLKYYLFSEDSNNYYENSSNFSGLEKYYKEQLDYFCTSHTYIDSETGEEKNSDEYIYYPPDSSDEFVTVELQPFTEKESRRNDEFIRSALKKSVKPDVNIQNIVNEETTAYFADERSAEKTAEIIQNRVSIYLSEQS